MLSDLTPKSVKVVKAPLNKDSVIFLFHSETTIPILNEDPLGTLELSKSDKFEFLVLINNYLAEALAIPISASILVTSIEFGYSFLILLKNAKDFLDLLISNPIYPALSKYIGAVNPLLE